MPALLDAAQKEISRISECLYAEDSVSSVFGTVKDFRFAFSYQENLPWWYYGEVSHIEYQDASDITTALRRWLEMSPDGQLFYSDPVMYGFTFNETVMLSDGSARTAFNVYAPPWVELMFDTSRKMLGVVEIENMDHWNTAQAIWRMLSVDCMNYGMSAFKYDIYKTNISRFLEDVKRHQRGQKAKIYRDGSDLVCESTAYIQRLDIEAGL